MKTALIGLGMVADTHLRALADLKDLVHLEGVFARDHARCRTFAEGAAEGLGHTPIAFESVEQIAAAGLDFAIIATPPNARLESVDALSAAGVHILMEKPVERDSARAAEIINLCEARNVTLGIVFQHRVREASIKLRELIDAGTFGALSVVDVAVPWWRDQAYYDEPGRGTYARDGGGVLISQAIHTLDLMLSLTGPVTRVQAMARTSRFHTMESEDFVTAGMDFANGAIGSLVASTASYPGDAESITLHFEHASALLKSGKLAVTWRDGRSDIFGADATTGGGADPMAFTHDWHTGIIRDFADALADNRAPLVTGREALNVHHLIDALVTSSRERCAKELETL